MPLHRLAANISRDVINAYFYNLALLAALSNNMSQCYVFNALIHAHYFCSILLNISSTLSISSNLSFVAHLVAHVGLYYVPLYLFYFCMTNHCKVLCVSRIKRSINSSILSLSCVIASASFKISLSVPM